MAEEFLPVRAYNRSQNVRIEKQKIGTTSSTIINIGNATTHKEFQYHSAIGAIFPSGPLSTSLYITLYGLGVTPKTTESKEIKIAAGEIKKRGTTTVVPVAAVEKTLEETTTNPRIDLVLVKLAEGAVSILKGTAAAVPVVPTVEEGYVAIAQINIPKETEKVKAENIVSLRAYL